MQCTAQLFDNHTQYPLDYRLGSSPTVAFEDLQRDAETDKDTMLCLARGKPHEGGTTPASCLLVTGEVVSVCDQQLDCRDLDDKALSLAQTASLSLGPMLTQN